MHSKTGKRPAYGFGLILSADLAVYGAAGTASVLV